MDRANKRRTGPPASCVCCGKLGPIMARGLREKCYWRWRRVGKLHTFEPSRRSGVYRLETRAALNRAERYREMTSGPGRLSRNRACIVLGISTRTAYRYEAWIREQGATSGRGEGDPRSFG